MAADPLKIFICYAREDRDPLEMLRKKLAPLVHSGRIQVWYDREITGGKEWDHEIRFNLKTADVVLLLISDDFFESDYIKSVELREALDGHARQENVVVPVILYDCLWDAHHELSRLQALPEEAKPIFVEEHWKKPDLGFANVARGVLRVLDDPATTERRQRKITRLEQLAAAEAAAREARKRKEENERAEKEKEERKRREEVAPSFIEMVPVEGGTFLFGDKYEVTVSDFMIGKYPVTQKQWREIMGNNPSHFKGDDLPVESVSWEDAKAFIQKLNERFPGRNFRLPSEAEWEYAARGGRLSKGYVYAGSNDLDEVGWSRENSGDRPLFGECDKVIVSKNNCRTHQVGRKKPNELDIFDLNGNVWEWCEDYWIDNQSNIPRDGNAWVEKPQWGEIRVVRGGGYLNDATNCHIKHRSYFMSDKYVSDVGFRLVSSLRR